MLELLKVENKKLRAQNTQQSGVITDLQKQLTNAMTSKIDKLMQLVGWDKDSKQRKERLLE